MRHPGFFFLSSVIVASKLPLITPLRACIARSTACGSVMTSASSFRWALALSRLVAAA
jgi:hypothetical protein